MRSNTQVALAASNASPQNGAAIDANQLVSASFAIYMGDATGTSTVKIQASNDLPTGLRGTFVPTNWHDIPSASVATVANTKALILIPVISFNYIRVVSTPTVNGSTTVNVSMCALGV